MSDSKPSNISHHESWWLLSLAGLAGLALVFGVAFSGERPVPVTIDGTALTLAEGTTVAELKAKNAFTARPGRLLSVQGSVIDTEGGHPVRVEVNGREAEDATYVFRRNTLLSYDGADTVETTAAVRIPIPVETRVVGRGPLMRLANPGRVGVLERVAGARSKLVVSERILKPAQDMVVIRTRPHPQEKLIALTFDDGPRTGQTDKILKILEREGVHATFFMLGSRVQAAPELARKVAMAGNLIGSHSLGHRLLTKSRPKVIKEQIDGGADEIYQATGVLPTWFRPPYGAINGAVWKQVRLSRMRVALWDIDTRDWSRPGVKKIVKSVTKDARNGSIVLMHDGGSHREQTIKALPEIIRTLKKRGFVFVTIEELANAE